jgi:hypothetical protein
MSSNDFRENSEAYVIHHQLTPPLTAFLFNGSSDCFFLAENWAIVNPIWSAG